MDIFNSASGSRSSVELRKKEKTRKNDMIDILIDALTDYEVAWFRCNLKFPKLEHDILMFSLFVRYYMAQFQMLFSLQN